jgi:hypothetical protein
VTSAIDVSTVKSRFVSREPTRSTTWSTSSSVYDWSMVSLTPSWVPPTSVHDEAGGVVLTTASAGSVAPNAPEYRVAGP